MLLLLLNYTITFATLLYIFITQMVIMIRIWITISVTLLTFRRFIMFYDIIVSFYYSDGNDPISITIFVPIGKLS